MDQFDLITLWASIEHLHKPKETLEKIYTHLKPGGRVILSTCRWGILAKLQGPSWRYLNVPEHLYYYSLPGIVKLCRSLGFQKKNTSLMEVDLLPKRTLLYFIKP